MPVSHRRVFFAPLAGALSGLFSTRVESSLRLRFLGLATFWLAALALAWVGGNPWTWLGGGIAATCGHAFSWYRRDRSLGVWPAVMALMVIALAFVMRSEMLAAFDGNWLPLAHFLLLVQTVSSFDIRTRGGLYAGLALSGIVLFFASQQAFDLSFGMFLLGYASLLMGFLAVAFLEDESKAARGRPAGKRLSLVGFWSVTIVAVLMFSVLAFLLLPRGESNAVGYQQVSALPIMGGLEGPQSLVQEQTRSSLNPPPGISGADSSLSGGERGGNVQRAGDATAPVPRVSQPGSGQGFLAGMDAFFYPGAAGDGDDVVMHVRSPVLSYWRGQTFATFDGSSWRPEISHAPESSAGNGLGNPLRYTQTYFIRREQPGTIFMGYTGVEVLSSGEVLYQRSLGKGFSYKVVSVQPELVPEKLREDRPGRPQGDYYSGPYPASRLRDLASQVTRGAGSGFDAAVGIVDYLRGNATYDGTAANQLETSAPLEELLFEGRAGSSVDFATATVMLARAAGLPARLAVGYLPGERDLLSGAYTVRDRDAHAWAEIFFEEHGWVPFDGTPRPELASVGRTGGGQLGGLRYLFESSVGDDLLRGALTAPSKLSGGLRGAFESPASTALAVVVAGAIFVALGWLGFRFLRKGRRPAAKQWSYFRLPGEGRDEMLRIHRRVEKLLRSQGLPSRRPGQALQEYARIAAERLGGAGEQLAWFTRAAWSAAYDPAWGWTDASAQILHEARTRLSSLKAALG